jgi:2-dehydro-3-deoxygalactonokinase
MVVVLSSHTKFVPVDAAGRILGGLTTISGQVFDAVKTGTVIGKSVAGSAETPPPEDHPELVHAAYEWSRTAGMLRGLFITRFLDTLLETSVGERQLYLETVVAAEDLKVVSELAYLGFPAPSQLVLIGHPGRVRLYKHLFETELQTTKRITTITDDREVDRLSILGAISLLREAGVVS